LNFHAEQYFSLMPLNFAGTQNCGQRLWFTPYCMSLNTF